MSVARQEKRVAPLVPSSRVFVVLPHTSSGFRFRVQGSQIMIRWHRKKYDLQVSVNGL